MHEYADSPYKSIKSIKRSNCAIQAEIHVSPAGSDTYDGTMKQPFKTLEKARNAVREINGNMTGDIVVYLHGGTYAFTGCLAFDASDSGSNGFYVTYKAYNGEKPVISGGVKVSGWKKLNDSPIENMWVVDVPDIEYTRQLYVNGRKAQRPKSKITPSTDWAVLNDPDMTFCNLAETVDEYEGIPFYEGYKTSKKDMIAWENQGDIEFVYDVGWTHSICPVDEIIPYEGGAFIRMRMPCFRDCQTKIGVRIGSPNYIENVFELMDEPGEWYFVSKARKIYYIPLPGEDMEHIEAVIPAIEKLVEIKGTPDRPACNIRLEGLTFMHTSFHNPGKSGHAELQGNLVKDPLVNSTSYSAFMKTPSSVSIDAAGNIVIYSCEFTRLGSGAIDIRNGSKNNMICGCKFHEIDGSGVQIGGFNMMDAHPGDPRETVKDNCISNCCFNCTGVEYPGSIPVIAGFTDGTVISHNEICHVPYSGVSVGWGWGAWDEDAGSGQPSGDNPNGPPRFNKPSVCRNNKIEYNHIHHVMQRLHDGGGIYTLSMQQGSAIVGNHIHDNGHFKGNGHKDDVVIGSTLVEGRYDDELVRVAYLEGFPGGVYLDHATGGYEVTGNIIYNVNIPIFHNYISVGRVETLRIHDNYCRIRPGEQGFPSEQTQKAGLEEEFRHLLWEV